MQYIRVRVVLQELRRRVPAATTARRADQLEIDALKEAAAWPSADQRTLVVLASQLMAAGLYQEGFDYFAVRSDAAPGAALSLALAGAFETSLDGRTEQAIAKLDAAR